MSLLVKIPAVGESITSAVLSTWHKADGEAVSKGDTLLTIDTDKVSTDLVAEGAGILSIKVPAGQEVGIGEVVAEIAESAQSQAPIVENKAPAKASKLDKGEKMDAPKVVAPTASPVHADIVSSTIVSTPASGGASLREAVSAANESLTVLNPSLAPERAASEGRISRKKMTPLRRKIAAQLVMAQQQAAILTTFNECDLSAVMKLRSEMQEAFTKEYGVKLGFMSFFIKAVVSALQAVPSINAQIDGEDIVQNHYFDVGVAVGTDRGLMVPVVRDADQKGFARLEKDLADFAVKAREGKIQFSDLQGGVFTISNGGIYGSLLSTPILNPPQSGILGMHKIQERPMVVNGQVVIRPMMYLALSYDHRVVDGKEAVTFLVRVKECLENPLRLMLGL